MNEHGQRGGGHAQPVGPAERTVGPAAPVGPAERAVGPAAPVGPAERAVGPAVPAGPGTDGPRSESGPYLQHATGPRSESGPYVQDVTKPRAESGLSRRGVELARPAWRRPEPWLTLMLVVLDQLTKLLVLQRIALHETVPVIPGLLNLTYVRNTGAAFGMLNAQDFAYKPLVVAALAVGALLGILWYARAFAGESWATRYGFVLIVAGAVGNLIDRLTLGYVVDFVDFYVGSWHFWSFNVADAAITIGAALFIADTLFSRRHVPEAV